MATILPLVDMAGVGTGYKVIRTGAAQANTGQTDWVAVPSWALWAEVLYNITAVAGTTPILTPSFLAADPSTLDDGDTAQIHADITSPPTAASFHRIVIGPGVGGTDDVALAAAADSEAEINASLPTILGVKTLLDRGTGDETYSYTVKIRFGR